MEKESIWDKIADLFSKEEQDVDEKEVKEWLAANPRNKQSLEIISSINFRFDAKPSEASKRASYANVMYKINKANARSRKLKIFYAAASISILLISGSVMYYLTNDNAGKSSLITTVCEKGVKSSITLEDGTVVRMNAGTSIQYPSKFAKENREITLDGEAYFAVAKMKSRPFIVHAAGVQIKVLGTHFNVKAYKLDTKVETTLEEGSVSLSKTGSENENVVLKPGEQAVYDKNDKNVSVSTVETSKATSWKDSKFYFKSMPLKDIIAVLEKEFRVKIVIKNKQLRDEQYTGDLVKGESVDQFLKIICQKSKVTYTNEMGTYYISIK